jgi:hypothetical protein
VVSAPCLPPYVAVLRRNRALHHIVCRHAFHVRPLLTPFKAFLQSTLCFWQFWLKNSSVLINMHRKQSGLHHKGWVVSVRTNGSGQRPSLLNGSSLLIQGLGPFPRVVDVTHTKSTLCLKAAASQPLRSMQDYYAA